MSRGNRSRKLDITVGQLLVVLLWLPVVAASETSRISVFPRSAVESVTVSPIATDGVSTTLSGDFVHYRKELIELREIFYAPFAFSAVDSSPSEALTSESNPSQSAAVRDFERSLAQVQPLLERYGYGAAVAGRHGGRHGSPHARANFAHGERHGGRCGGMNIALLLFLVTTAATVGNSIGYAIGRWGGRVVLGQLKINPQRQQYLVDLFKRRGG